MPVTIGVDPHKASHTAAALDEHGQLLDRQHVPATLAGYRALCQWAGQWPQRRWAVEGAHGIGRAVAQRLVGDGEQVLDVPAKLAARVRVVSVWPRPQERPRRCRLGGRRRPQRCRATAGWRGGPGGGAAPADQAAPGPGGRPHPDNQPAPSAADGPGRQRRPTQSHRQPRRRIAQSSHCHRRTGGHSPAAGHRARGQRAPAGAAHRRGRGPHQDRGRRIQDDPAPGCSGSGGCWPPPTTARSETSPGSPPSTTSPPTPAPPPLEASSGQVVRHRLSRAGVFACIDHYTAEAWAHVAKIGDRFAALQPVYDAVVDRWGPARSRCRPRPGAPPRLGPPVSLGPLCRLVGLARDRRQPRVPGEPETNGCPERWIRTLKDQCLWTTLHDTTDELRQVVAGFVDRYNSSWLIQRHGHLTPKEAYQTAQSASAA
jgi:hypothetical protein